ncbi:MAG TPA: hypothetical protein VEL06_09955 [Haliangiales bacterium]|nr:hypothetical protein [Haliangiales bacterium]
MKNHHMLFLAAAWALLAGCTSTRSISNSSYRDARPASGHVPGQPTDPGFEYRGELSEFDVLGVARDQTAFDDDIQQALEKARPVRLKPRTAILLIQSGAMFPDGPMVGELSKHFTVVPFSGVPPGKDFLGSQETRDSAGFSRSLRLAAARAGAETILCYWGVLETAQEKIATKAVSWVPVVTWFVPDEREHVRLRLKLALIDVRTGDWSVLSPPPFDSKALSVGTRRAVTDQKLVERLKGQAYEASVRDLMRVYVREEFSARRSNDSTPSP